MKLSILDQSPISSNQTAQDALYESVKLAQLGDELGYTRYWIAEHHDLKGLACSAPEVMLSLIGAKTKRIRIGSGAVLLPHYKPFKIAEIFNMLATLYPNRIDLGLGRAPGGSAEATNALSNNFLQKVYQFPELVDELLHFFNQDFPDDHDFSRVTASPFPDVTPVPWILGTSRKSAILAAEKGLPYAFGQFMSEVDGKLIVNEYKNMFKPSKQLKNPQTLLTVTAVCAETTEKAEEIALSNLIWSLQKDKGEGDFVPSIEEAKNYKLTNVEKQKLEERKAQMIIGNPQEVSQSLMDLQEKFDVDEIMIVTITHDPEDRLKSYKLIADVLLK